MLNFLAKLFGGGNSINGMPQVTGGEEDLTSFVRYVVCSLVDEPKQVEINTDTSDKLTVIKISCKKQDIGKIIGKNGKTIDAIRSLVNGAAGRLGKKANVEVLD